MQLQLRPHIIIIGQETCCTYLLYISYCCSEHVVHTCCMYPMVACFFVGIYWSRINHTDHNPWPGSSRLYIQWSDSLPRAQWEVQRAAVAATVAGRRVYFKWGSLRIFTYCYIYLPYNLYQRYGLSCGHIEYAYPTTSSTPLTCKGKRVDTQDVSGTFLKDFTNSVAQNDCLNFESSERSFTHFTPAASKTNFRSLLKLACAGLSRSTKASPKIFEHIFTSYFWGTDLVVWFVGIHERSRNYLSPHL